MDKKLRDDARHLLWEYGSTTLEPAPLLAVRVEWVYERVAESIPLTV